MTRVVQDLFKVEDTGSRNRPDFVILPDGTAGLYSHPMYDDETGGEIGVARLVIVELKKPTITIGAEEKSQCWTYVKELYEKGMLHDGTKVTCFALGPSIDPQETEPREEKGGRVVIRPLTYDTIITRAKSRLLNLSDKVKSAPFLSEEEKNVLREYEKGVVEAGSGRQTEFSTETQVVVSE
jgi:hypothetical protein